MADTAHVTTDAVVGELRQARFGALTSGRYLCNVLAAAGVVPTEIANHREAATHDWPAVWTYDAWCAWYACKLTLEQAGWSWAVDEISVTAGSRIGPASGAITQLQA